MHPGRRPLRRLGTASVLVSTGALLILTAVPAAAAEEECKKGVDPETTIANITCQWNNNVETIKNEIDKAQGKDPKDAEEDEPALGAHSAPDETKPKPKPKKPKSTPAAPSAPGPAATYRAPAAPQGSTQPLPETPTDTLPEPRVAEAPTALALPETHLVAPISAITPAGDPSRALWTAAASAAATAALMAQFSILGRRLRRPR
ncbi:hypothetical protein GCM10022221_42870 [Actinocorallia aurea]